MVVTVSTATPIVLPVWLALVVAPVVLTPVADTVTVVLEFVLVVPLLLLDDPMEPLPSLLLDEPMEPLLVGLLAANAHTGCDARATVSTNAAMHFFFISFTSPFSPKSSYIQ